MGELDATWGPRVGQEAAALLKRRARLGALPIAFLVLLVASALLLNDAAYYAVAAALYVGLIVVYVVLSRRVDRDLAAALTQHLGFPVSTQTLPRFVSASSFDTWLANQRSGRPPRRHSFLRGFIKIDLPARK